MKTQLTIILPYFNELGWVGKTIDSLVAQTDQDFRLILVDNASSDGSAAEAQQHALSIGNRVTFLHEPVPGKSNALAAALTQVETEIVAICDADTHYPPAYVRGILDMFRDHPDAVAVMAIDLYDEPGSAASRHRIRKIMDKVVRHPSKCHAGGYAQAFKTEMLRRAEAFDTVRWPFILEDHEIAYRVMCHGTAVYNPDHFCFPSLRRANRKSMDWTRTERLLYRYVPAQLLGWFFYRFLGPRLARRGAFATIQRAQSWKPVST